MKYQLILSYYLPGSEPEHYEEPLFSDDELTPKSLDDEIKAVTPQTFTGGVTFSQHNYDDPGNRYIIWMIDGAEEAEKAHSAIAKILFSKPKFSWELKLGIASSSFKEEK